MLKIKLEIGDKLLCKKSYSNFINKNKYYKIVKCHRKLSGVNNNNIIYDDYPYGVEFNFDLYNFYFYLNQLKQNDSDYLWDYFYKPNEERKVKLKKILNGIETSNNN